MDFLPPNYDVPTSSGKYMKLEQGDNLIRILGSPIIGYLDWNGKTPVRTSYTKGKPKAINPANPVKHFWAFPIWNYKKNTVQIMEVTQSTIQNDIYALSHDEAWGNPINYDLLIKKTGESKDTRYQTIARPPKPLTPEILEEYSKLKINLNKLFTNEDPFEETPTKTMTADEALDDLPFN